MEDQQIRRINVPVMVAVAFVPRLVVCRVISAGPIAEERDHISEVNVLVSVEIAGDAQQRHFARGIELAGVPHGARLRRYGELARGMYAGPIKQLEGTTRLIGQWRVLSEG